MAQIVDKGAIGQSRRTGRRKAETDKALSDVEISGGRQQGGSFGVLSFMSGHDTDRELTQEGALDAYHSSPPILIAVSPIVRAVGGVSYGWEADSEPADFSLAQPNRWHQSAEYFGLAAAYLKLAGEFYAIKKDGANGPELWPIPPHLMDPPEVPHGNYQVEDGAIGGLTSDEFERDELVVINEPQLKDPVIHGHGAGQTAGWDADISEAAAEHTATYLENNARPDAIISGEGLGRDEFDRLRDTLTARHGGPENAGRLEGLGADVSIHELMQPFDELGTPELRRYSAEVARHIFGVPPSLVGDVSDTNRATAETEEYLFKKNTIKPIVDKIVEGHNEQFVAPEIDGDRAITTGQIVPDDRRLQLEAMKELPQAFRVNEARQLANFEPLDDGGSQTLAEAAPTRVQRGEGAAEQKKNGLDASSGQTDGRSPRPAGTRRRRCGGSR